MDQGRARILVIDDDPKISRIIGRALAPEYDAVVLTSAQQALDLITGGEGFDVILCDLVLPGIDGILFHERLGLVAPELVERMVIVTGGAFTARAEAFLASIDLPRLEKPFGIEDLRRSVRGRLLLRSRPARDR